MSWQQEGLWGGSSEDAVGNLADSVCLGFQRKLRKCHFKGSLGAILHPGGGRSGLCMGK